MSYVNRFTFKHSIGFRLLERGFPYLKRIKKIEIDGNLVHATIEGTELYDVTALINYQERILSFPTCSCPYQKDHRHCKHLGAIVLYLDLYLNGGSVYELENYIISEVALLILNNLDKYSIPLNGETILKAMVDKNIFTFGYDFGHIMFNSDIFNKLPEKRVIEALRMLERMHCIKIFKDENIKILKSQVPEKGYYSFFAKYSFLEATKEIWEYEEDDDCYLERGDLGTYFYGKKQDEVDGGVDVVNEYGLVADYRYLKTYLDIENKVILDEIEYEDIENKDFYSYVELPKFQLSNNIVEYLVGLLPDNENKTKVIELYEDNKLDYDTLLGYLTPNLKSKINNIVKNYYIGKLVEFCLENRVHFYFRKSYSSTEYDFTY